MAYAVAGKLVTGQLLREPRVNYGPAFAGYSWQFFVTGTAIPATIYQDQNLTTPFSPSANVAPADSFGRFPPIYLDPSIVYKAQLYNASSVLQRTQDPYQSPLSTWGTSQLVSTGPKISAFNEVSSLNSAGGTGVAWTISATPPGGACLKISGTIPGAVTLEIDSSATTGAQTATFTATNKPGIATSVPVAWLPIKCDGTVYYTPLWRGDTFVPIPPIAQAFGQNISASTAEWDGDGTTTLTGAGASATPPAWFTPTTTGIGSGYWINFTKTGGLSGLTFTQTPGSWINIGAGGLTVGSTGQGQVTGTYQLSTTAGGTPVVANGTISVQNGNGPQNTNYSGTASLVLGGNGTATLNGAGATNWYLPTTANIGSGYWIDISFTSSSPSGLSFTAAQGAFTNITNGGLTIGMSSFFNNATVNGTYQISSNSGGTAIVGQGSISLTGNGTGPAYSGTENLVLAGNGTATLAGSGVSNWYNPTTSNIGSSYWVDIARTGGTSGVNFTAAQGSFTNITNGGLTIGITNYFTNVNVTGTMSVAANSGGSPVLATYALNLSGNGTGPSFSGTENLSLNGDGTTNIGGSGTTNWYTPTTASIGGSYWVEISGIGGGPGTFNTAVGSWVNISNGGLAIGTTNFFNTTTVTGTLSYSSSSSGTPVVGTSSISVSGNGTGPAYSGTENLVLNGDGTATVNGGGVTNWYTPTTASIGASYWVNITGVSGPGFNAAQGAWTNVSAGGLTIGTNNFLSNVTTTGTLNYSSSSSGTPNIGTSSISLTGNGTGPALSGAANFVMNSDGSITFNGAGSTNWYTPSTASIGNGYWVQLVRTGGDTGVTFNNGLSGWTALSSAFTVGLTNLVGNHSVNGTYSISSSASGSPVVGSGTLTLTQNITSLLRIYSGSSSGTETIPIGASSVDVEVWGGGGGGGANTSTSFAGAGGGAGGYSRCSFSLTSANYGQTFNYTAGAAGTGSTGNPGTTGGTSTVSSGTFTISTITCTGGGGGAINQGAGGSGGTGTNANAGATNITGAAGNSNRTGGASTNGLQAGPYGFGGTGHSSATVGAGGAGDVGHCVFYYT